MCEPVTPELQTTTLVTLVFSDGSRDAFDPAQDIYPVQLIVETTTSVIAPGLSKVVG